MALTEHQVASVREGFELHREHGVDATLLDAAGARALVDSPRYLGGLVDPDRRSRRPRAPRLGTGRRGRAARRAAARGHGGHGVRPRGRSRRRAHRVGQRAGRPRGARHRRLPRPAQAARPVDAAGLRPRADVRAAVARPAGCRGLARARGAHRRGQPVPLLPAHPRRPRALRWLRRQLPLPGPDRPERSSSRASHDLLARHFLEIFPQLEGVRFTHRWAGVIDTTSRFTPVFGTALGGRLAYAVGYTGLGRGLDPLRRPRRARPRRRPRHRGHPAADGAAQADALPARADPVRRGAGHPASLAAEDRTGRRNLWLRGLDAAGVGFDS